MIQSDGRAIAVLDIGKTNAKLIVWNPQLTGILFKKDCANKTIQSAPYPHLDVAGLWDFYLDALCEAASRIEIGKIICTTHGATVAILKGDELALPVHDYEGTYDQDLNLAYDKIRDGFAHTQSPNLPAGLNFGRQIFALEEKFPDEMAKATDFMPYAQYWAWLLSAVKSTEITSIGCHSDLWRPYQKTWSNLALARGWHHKFPPMHNAGDKLGTIRPEIAKKTGIAKDCAVYCGLHDSNASLVPLIRQFQAPFTLVSSGTWTILFSVGNPSRPTLDEGQDTLCNIDINGQAVPSARFMGGREYDFLSQGYKKNPSLAAIQNLLSNNCMALPSFAEAGGPFCKNKGHILNHKTLRSDDDKAALATLYCALMTDYCLQQIESLGTIIIEGPFAQNSVFCGLLAALRTGQQVLASNDTSGTSFGAALLSCPALPISRNLHQVAPLGLAEITQYKKSWLKELQQPVASF